MSFPFCLISLALLLTQLHICSIYCTLFFKKITTVLLQSRCHKELNAQTVIYHGFFWQDKSTPSGPLIYQPFHCNAHFCEVLHSDVMSKVDFVLTDPLPSKSALQSGAANGPQLLCYVMTPVCLAQAVRYCLISQIKSCKVLNGISSCNFEFKLKHYYGCY